MTTKLNKEAETIELKCAPEGDKMMYCIKDENRAVDTYTHNITTKLNKKAETINLKCTFEGDTLPKYIKDGDSAMDVHAYKMRTILEGDTLSEIKDIPDTGYILKPLERVLITSGLKIEFTDDIDCTCRPRSGMTLKHGIVTQIGMIDTSYRGDIGLIVFNLSNNPYTISKGERLGQLRFSRPILAKLIVVDNIDKDTERKETGFGASGK